MKFTKNINKIYLEMCRNKSFQSLKKNILNSFI